MDAQYVMSYSNFAAQPAAELNSLIGVLTLSKQTEFMSGNKPIEATLLNYSDASGRRQSIKLDGLDQTWPY